MLLIYRRKKATTLGSQNECILNAKGPIATKSTEVEWQGNLKKKKMSSDAYTQFKLLLTQISLSICI